MARASDLEIRYLGDVQRLSLKPGDVVVLSYADRLSDAARAFVTKALRKAFPDHRCLILEDGAQIGVIESITANEFEAVTLDGKVVQRITVD